MVRVASFNVENLFERPKALATENDAQQILAAYAEVNRLIAKEHYSDADKAAIKAHLATLRVLVLNEQNALRVDPTFPPVWAWLRENRGRLFDKPGADDADVPFLPKGRSDWVGWVELVQEAVKAKATQLTARVIQDVAPDILAVVEAEHRPSLKRFNEQLLGSLYRHIMLVDGNDDRGIDVGIMTKGDFPIGTITSNVDRMDGDVPVFSRDCAQYRVATPSGNTLHVLVNHFKSQTKGANGDNGGAKRKKQAQAVREIVDGLVASNELVIVLGDLNEGPNEGFAFAKNLRDLYDNDSPLVDCWSLEAFDRNGAPGSWRWSDLRNRLDYIFLSKHLAERFRGGGVFRKGVWRFPDAAGDWAMYPELEQPDDAASDHGLLFVDLDV